MNPFQSIEERCCHDYLRKSKDEGDLLAWVQSNRAEASLIVTQGFEERSVGVLEAFAEAHTRVPKVIVGQYANGNGPNDKYQDRFEQAADTVSQMTWEAITHGNEGTWIEEAIRKTQTEHVIIDITGLSNRALFGALDRAAASKREILIAYSEAGVYWPREEDWKSIERELTGYESFAEIFDKKPWLFGHEHQVEFVPEHDGYDSAGCGRALIGFLPFKRARLAAVLGEEDYAEFLFVAGRPRLPENAWRLDALKKINEDIVKERHIVDMDTFGYRNALGRLAGMLFCHERLAEKYDVHMAILGSKLQGVGCWALSCMVPSLTVLTSIPSEYYTEAFSEHIGARWIFPLTRPEI